VGSRPLDVRRPEGPDDARVLAPVSPVFGRVVRVGPAAIELLAAGTAGVGLGRAALEVVAGERGVGVGVFGLEAVEAAARPPLVLRTVLPGVGVLLGGERPVRAASCGVTTGGSP